MKRSMICAILILSFNVFSEEKAPPAKPTAEDIALSERAEKAVATAQGTFGREAANFLGNPKSWVHHLVLVLKGEKPGDTGYARKIVEPLVKQAEAGPEWPKPARMEIPYAVKAPLLDGSLGADPSWKTALSVLSVYELNQKEKSDGAGTAWHLLWDEKYLYVLMEAQDNDIRAPDVPRDGPVWEQDCLEIFILPALDSPQYLEILVGAKGALFDALHTKQPDAWGPLPNGPAKNFEDLRKSSRIIAAQPGAKQKYEIEIAVPFKDLPGFEEKKPEAGQVLYLMLGRADADSQGVKYYSYTPVLSWFHNIWNYGEFVLKK